LYTLRQQNIEQSIESEEDLVRNHFLQQKHQELLNKLKELRGVLNPKRDEEMDQIFDRFSSSGQLGILKLNQRPLPFGPGATERKNYRKLQRNRRTRAKNEKDYHDMKELEAAKQQKWHIAKLQQSFSKTELQEQKVILDTRPSTVPKSLSASMPTFGTLGTLQVPNKYALQRARTAATTFKSLDTWDESILTSNTLISTGIPHDPKHARLVWTAIMECINNGDKSLITRAHDWTFELVKVPKVTPRCESSKFWHDIPDNRFFFVSTILGQEWHVYVSGEDWRIFEREAIVFWGRRHRETIHQLYTEGILSQRLMISIVQAELATAEATIASFRTKVSDVSSKLGWAVEQKSGELKKQLDIMRHGLFGKPKAMNVFFCIDSSKSMENNGRMTRVREDLIDFLQRLPRSSSFSLATFSPTELWEEELQPSKERDAIDAACDYIRQIQCEGADAVVLDALNDAVSVGEIDTIFLVSDGELGDEPSEVIAGVEQILADRAADEDGKPLRINTIAFDAPMESIRVFERIAAMSGGTFHNADSEFMKGFPLKTRSQREGTKNYIDAILTGVVQETNIEDHDIPDEDDEEEQEEEVGEQSVESLLQPVAVPAVEVDVDLDDLEDEFADDYDDDDDDDDINDMEGLAEEEEFNQQQVASRAPAQQSELVVAIEIPVAVEELTEPYDGPDELDQKQMVIVNHWLAKDPHLSEAWTSMSRICSLHVAEQRAAGKLKAAYAKLARADREREGHNIPVELSTLEGHLEAQKKDVEMQKQMKARMESAVKNEKFDVVLKMIQAGKFGIDHEVDCGDTPLMAASRAGNVEAMQLLLKKNAHINHESSKTGTTALIEACKAGQRDAVNFLLEAGANVDRGTSHGDTPLGAAVGAEQLVIVNLLLGKGEAAPTKLITGKAAQLLVLAHSYLQMADGTTAWMAACASSSSNAVSIVNSFIDNGLQVNTTAHSNNQTGLMCAAYRGQERTAELLLSHGADSNLEDADGCTALHYAARENHMTVVQLLVNEGKIDINHRDADGNTALIGASARGHNEVAGLLIGLGADIELTNDAGQTAFEAAMAYQQRQLDDEAAAEAAQKARLEREEAEELAKHEAADKLELEEAEAELQRSKDLVTRSLAGENVDDELEDGDNEENEDDNNAADLQRLVDGGLPQILISAARWLQTPDSERNWEHATEITKGLAEHSQAVEIAELEERQVEEWAQGQLDSMAAKRADNTRLPTAMDLLGTKDHDAEDVRRQEWHAKWEKSNAIGLYKETHPQTKSAVELFVGTMKDRDRKIQKDRETIRQKRADKLRQLQKDMQAAKEAEEHQAERDAERQRQRDADKQRRRRAKKDKGYSALSSEFLPQLL
jgi:ankyrin repeat protein